MKITTSTGIHDISLNEVLLSTEHDPVAYECKIAVHPDYVERALIFHKGQVSSIRVKDIVVIKYKNVTLSPPKPPVENIDPRDEDIQEDYLK